MARSSRGPALHVCRLRRARHPLHSCLEGPDIRDDVSAAEGEIASWRLFGIDLLPHIVATVGGLLRALAWVLTVFLIYLWVTLSFRRFPYTAPWGEQAGGYVLNSIRELGNTVIRGLPGLLVVVLILLLTRWIVRMANAVFDQMATGKIAVSWMDADVARATHRIFSAIMW